MEHLWNQLLSADEDHITWHQATRSRACENHNGDSRSESAKRNKVEGRAGNWPSESIPISMTCSWANADACEERELDLSVAKVMCASMRPISWKCKSLSI